MVNKPGMFHETTRTLAQEDPQAAPLESAVADALAVAGGIDASDVTVTAVGSVIVLEGNVLQLEEISLATEIARSVPGVSAVDNRLTAAGLNDVITGYRH